MDFKKLLLVLFVFLVTLNSCSNDSKNEIVSTQANHAPVITELSAQPNRTIGKTLVQFSCVAHDYDNDDLSYEWKTETNQIIGHGITFTWKAINQVHVYDIICTVNDGKGGIDKDTVRFQVYEIAPNEAPIITSIDIDNANLSIGDTTRIFCKAIDYDYNLSDRYDIYLKGEGELFSKYQTNAAVFKATAAGDVNISFTVYDTNNLYSEAVGLIKVSSNSLSTPFEIQGDYPVITEFNFPDTVKQNQETILEAVVIGGTGSSSQIVNEIKKGYIHPVIGSQNIFTFKAEETGEYFINFWVDGTDNHFMQKVKKIIVIE